MTHFFKDKDGHVVLWQRPNIPLIGWAVFRALSLIVKPEHTKTSVALLSTAFLFTWAFLEITKGVNYFRRLLGLLVFAAIVVGFFK